jgi:hypothetical protein
MNRIVISLAAALAVTDVLAAPAAAFAPTPAPRDCQILRI